MNKRKDIESALLEHEKWVQRNASNPHVGVLAEAARSYLKIPQICLYCTLSCQPQVGEFCEICDGQEPISAENLTRCFNALAAERDEARNK